MVGELSRALSNIKASIGWEADKDDEGKIWREMKEEKRRKRRKKVSQVFT